MGSPIRRHVMNLVVLVISAMLVFSTIAIAAPGNKRSGERSRRVPAAVGDRRFVVCDGSVAVGAQCFVRGVGTLNASNQVTKIGTGTFDIRFDIGIRQCAYVGTIGLPGNSGSSAPGEITVVGRAGTNNGVFVQTFDSSGTIADRSFHLAIFC